MSKEFCFDGAYYRRHYVDPRTRAMTPAAFRRLVDFVCSYIRYLDLPVRRVLDIGCGLGLWREALAGHFPRASYTGVETSRYLCDRYGWEYGSVIDYRSRRPFDLVICNDVLQYLDAADAAAAIENLAVLCRGVLYFGVLTEEDWTEGNCDRSRTDARGYLRSGKWYRKRLRAHFDILGGGLHVSERSSAVLYELEKL